MALLAWNSYAEAAIAIRCLSHHYVALAHWPRKRKYFTSRMLHWYPTLPAEKLLFQKFPPWLDNRSAQNAICLHMYLRVENAEVGEKGRENEKPTLDVEGVMPLSHRSPVH